MAKMIKVTAITLQGAKAPIQEWDLYLNIENILTVSRDHAGKTCINMVGEVPVHVAESPKLIVEMINSGGRMVKTEAPYLPKT